MGHMGVPRTVASCPMWDNGTGRTLGTSYVRWDTWESLGLSCPVPCGTVGRDGHLGQAMGHMGVPRTVPSCPMWDSGTGRTLGISYVRWDTWESLGLSRPVPCGTVGRDGHLCTMGHMGVPRTVPSCPMWDNGTGRILGTSYVRWDTWESLGLSLLSHVGQWDRTDT